MIESIFPKSKAAWLELRASNVSSTEVSALFGCNPYITKFQLWHQKKNMAVDELEPNERMKWGTRLQNSIAYGIAEDKEWTCQPKNEYIFDKVLNYGASFDFEVSNPEERCLLEIKNVDYLAFKNGWLLHEDGELEAPAHIELQVQHQLLVSGLQTAYIGALVGGNDVKLIKREADKNVHQAIKNAVAAFWKSIADNKPPEPDFGQDAEFISKLYGYSEPGKFRTANETIDKLASEYKSYSDTIRVAEGFKQEVKAKLLMIIEDAEKVMGHDFTISAGVVGPKLIEAHERKGYRNFRINWRTK